MRTPLVVFASLLALAGCTGSHVAPRADAGASTDAAPDSSIATTCRLTATTSTPGSAGEGCYCDGPFAVRGEVAYRLSFMLEVIDLHDADHPVLVTSVPQEARYSNDVEIVGDVLFAAGGALERFDLSDPLAPVSMGAVDLGGEATAMGVDGDQLVIAIRRDDGSHAIVAIDASDPRALVIGAPIELGANEASALTRAGSTAFAILQDVAAGGASLAAIDLATGRIASTLPQGSAASLSAIVAHRGHLFVSRLGEGVQLVDATTPTALVDLGLVALEVTNAFSLDLTGDRLVVLGGGAWLYDVSDPRALVPLGATDWTSDLGHAELLGDHLLVSGGNQLVSLPLACD